jgi:hypothetical protein
VTAYKSQCKAQTQLNGKSLQEFNAAVMQLAQQVPAKLPEDFIQRETANAFISGVKEQVMKQHPLMGSKRSPDPSFWLI